MTLQLSTLRVSADLDANKYLAGANSMTAANQSVAASGTAAGASVSTTQAKVAGAGDAWQRLSRQYVDGAAAEQRMTTALRTLQRGMDTNNISMQQAEQILDGLNRKLGVTANAEELAANGQFQLAQAVTNVNSRLVQQGTQHEMVSRKIGMNAGQLQNLSFQMNDVISGIAMGQAPMQILAQQGGQIVQVLGMAEGGIGGALAGLLPIIIPVGAALGVVALVIAGLTSAIDQNTGKTVSWMDTLKAVFQTLGDVIGGVFGPIFSWIATGFAKLVQAISPAIKTMVNGTVGGFRTAFDDIKDIWAMLPQVLGNVVIGTVNAVIGAVSSLFSGALEQFNRFLNQVNSAADVLHLPHVGLFDPDSVKIGPIDNPYAGALTDLGGKLAANADRDNTVDYGGAFMDDLTKHALENAANDNKKKKTKGGRHASFSDLMDDATTDTATLTAQAAALGQSSQQTAYLEEKQKLLNKALQQHITLTPDQIAKIDDAAQAYGRQKSVLEAMTEVYDTLKDSFTGFFSDLKSNLQQGQTFWEAFGTAASNALNKIADKALDMAASGIFDMLWSGGSTTGTGGLGGIIGGVISSLFPHNAQGTSNWTGGVTWVGEQGPELVNLPRGSQVMSNPRSMAMMSAANQNAINFAPVYNINAVGLSMSQLQQVLAHNNSAMLKQLPTVMRESVRRAA